MLPFCLSVFLWTFSHSERRWTTWSHSLPTVTGGQNSPRSASLRPKKRSVLRWQQRWATRVLRWHCETYLHLSFIRIVFFFFFMRCSICCLMFCAGSSQMYNVLFWAVVVGREGSWAEWGNRKAPGQGWAAWGRGKRGRGPEGSAGGGEGPHQEEGCRGEECRKWNVAPIVS